LTGSPQRVYVLAMATPVVRTRRWSRLEYERLVDLGVFNPGENLELLDGLLLVREPQNARHATAVRAVQEALRHAFSPGWDVRPQLPIALDDASEPEPDIAVVQGSYRDYQGTHPSHPVLLVEIAESTLAADRRKAGLYARAAVPEYWIVNLIDDVVEVHRQPARSPLSRFGWTYANIQVFRRGDALSSLAAPQASVAVADLLV
jgi:Uma2 family endonuclease